MDKDSAVLLEGISKRYRIGLKDEIHDNFAQTLFDFLKSPFRNYRKYRSLYRFDDLADAREREDVIWALNEVSFEIKKGEVVGIIGRNGAGKSTLLKILSRITDPTRGKAEIRGRISSLLEVGTGFHQELTGRENVYLNATILGMRKKEVDRKFDQIVEFSGIGKFIDTPVKRYSSGMKVRLGFSVAAHLEPEILIVDEVLAVGDADFQKKCINKMENVGSEGRTVLFVSHNMPAITRLCSRCIFMEQGAVQVDGPAGQVVKSYLNTGGGTPAECIWRDAMNSPGGGSARLRAVRVRDSLGEVSDSIDIRTPLCIEMEYEILEGGKILLPHFSLKNEEGNVLFVTVEQDKAWRGKPRPEGKYLSRVFVPGNLLAEGTLFVTCTLITLQPEAVLFRERSVVSFQVIDTMDGDSARGDYSKNIPGIVRPLLEWSTIHLDGNSVPIPSPTEFIANKKDHTSY